MLCPLYRIERERERATSLRIFPLPALCPARPLHPISPRNATMSHRLRHRAHFDPLSITHALNLRAPRLQAPPQWQWSYPLHITVNAPSSAPIRHVWLSAIRTVAISDDCLALAFLSHSGAVALSTRPDKAFTFPPASTVSLDFTSQHQAIEWTQSATSLAIFSLSDTSSAAPRKLLAVGYHSGAIAIFHVPSAAPLTITRPYTHPVLRLRYYPTLHFLPQSPPYPIATSNSALVAIFGQAGHIARLSASSLVSMLSTPPTIDPEGAKTILWNLSIQDAIFDAVISSSHPSDICQSDPVPPAAPLRIITVGLNPPLAAHAVTSEPAFSARAAAKRAASTMLSVAKGFLFSTPTPSSQQDNQPVAAVVAVAKHTASWADDPASVHGLTTFGDVRDTARKSVNAVLQRGKPLLDSPSSPYSRTSLRDPLFANRPNSTGHPMDEQHRVPSPRSAAHPRNVRIIERVAAAPPPCTLIATCDTLGRIFIQDSKDLCVLRILKGYRDAHVAWLADDGPLLVVYAPRLNIIEIHGPLEQRRREAFRVLPGSMLIQSTAYNAFFVFPNGNVYQMMRGRKGQSRGDNRISRTEDASVANTIATARMQNESLDMQQTRMQMDDETAPEYELVGTFTEAIKTGQTSRAVECLLRVEENAYQVAHLMATLVTCATSTHIEMHIALASTAAQIASNLKNPDLLSRFEAHRLLAEAFGLIAVDNVPTDTSADKNTQSKYGPRLLEDDLGAGLEEFAIEESKSAAMSATERNGKRRTAGPDEQPIACEQFILSHALAPTFDLRSDVDYEIYPRSDLSEAEQVWLARAYFLKLLEEDAVNAPTPGREHPATVDVFQALIEYIGLSEVEITRQFVLFFLHTPLLSLLKTHVSLYASPLRCAIARIRSKFEQDAIHPIVLDACETTSRIPNAVLLVRLCAIHESLSDDEEENNPFLESLDRLGEVKLFRNMIAGSKVPREVYETFTARRCTGIPGDAERQAVTCLIQCDDYDRAAKVLAGLEMSRSLQNLDWHESASVSEAALHACRIKCTELISEEAAAVVPKGVIQWIQAAKKDGHEGSQLRKEKRNDVRQLSEIRSTLLGAQEYIPDSSVDAVRCLQLAEAMTALIQLESSRETVKPPPTTSPKASRLTAGPNGGHPAADQEESSSRNEESSDDQFFDALASPAAVAETSNNGDDPVPKVDQI